MSMVLKTFAGQSISPLDDALMRNGMAAGQDGVAYGLTLTKPSNSTIRFSAGYGMIQGREFQLTAAETVNITLASSGTKYGLVYLQMDLSNTSSPLSIGVQYANTEDGFTALTKNSNVNINSGIWQMELARITISTSDITAYTRTCETLGGVYTQTYTLNGIDFTFSKYGRLVIVTSSGTPTSPITTNAYVGDMTFDDRFKPAAGVIVHVLATKGIGMQVNIRSSGTFTYGFASSQIGSSNVRVCLCYFTAK